MRASCGAAALPCVVCVCRMMLVGLGGNNGTTVAAGILANKQ
jgi:hypothetical protein